MKKENTNREQLSTNNLQLTIIKKGWVVKKLGEVCDVRDGTHDSPKYQEKGYPLITSKNLKQGVIVYDKIKYISEEDYLHINKRSKVDIGDILFAMIGTIGNPVVIVNEPDYAIKNVALFKVGDLLDSYFLKFYLSSKFVIDKMQKDAKGTTQKFVGLGYLRAFEIPLPPLTQQKQIVKILDQAFTAIDKAKNNAQQNLLNAKQLFESYLQNVFVNGKLKVESGEWVEKSLGEVCEVIAGQSPESKFYNKNGDGLPFYQGKKEFTEKYIGEPTKWTTKITKEAIKDDILMSVRAPVGPINYSTQKICIGRGLAAIRASKLIEKEYLFNFLIKHENEIVGNTGAVFNSINKSQIGAIQIPIPPLKEQQKIVKKLNALQAQTKKLETIYEQKIIDLEELKKSILQKAFSGQLLMVSDINN